MRKISEGMKKAEWLKQDVPLDEISKGVQDRDYIQIGIIEELLDLLSEGEEKYWGTSDFSFEITRVNNQHFASGRISLSVTYDGKNRLLTGAKTIEVNANDTIKDYAGTVLSMCITSAASKLGNRFGRSLNERLDIKNGADIQTKPIADIVTEMVYSKAKREGDVLAMRSLESKYQFTDAENK